MADNNVGQISYTVDADTAPLLTAGNQVESANAGMQQAFNKTDKAAKSTEIQMKKTAMAVKKVNSGFKLQKGAATQVGYQLQDFAVQVGGGTSALVAFGQQGSQLAGILGPGGALLGAVIAIGSAIGGVLINSMSGASDGAKELQVDVRDLAEEMDKLTTAQINYTKIKINEKIEELSDALRLARVRAETFNVQLQRTPGSKKAEEWTRALAQQNAEVDTLTQDISKLNGTLGELSAAQSRVGNTQPIDRNTAAISGLVAALEAQANALGKTDREIAIGIATRDQATDAELRAINASFDKIDAYTAEQEAIKTKSKAEQQAITDTAKAKREAASQAARAPKQRAQVLGVIDEGQGARASTDLKIAEFQRLKDAAVISEQERAAAVLAVETQLQEQLGVLRETARVKQAEGLEAFALGFEAMAARVAVAAENPARVLGEDFANAAGTAGDAMADSFARSIIAGESLSESIRGIAQEFLTGILSSLIKVGAQYVVNEGIAAAAEAGITAASVAGDAARATSAIGATAAVTTAQVASSVTIAAAAAPAAALTTLASFGANIPIALAGIAAVGAAGLAIAGGRQYGGGVSAGSAYRVNEDGKPEMFSDGNRQYLIPGKNGNVTSNKDMNAGGGSAPIQVNFNIQESDRSSFQVQSVDQDETSVTISAIIADMDNGGPVSSAITRNTSATRRTT